MKELQTNRLGALIRARRRELGLTQADLAARINKSPSYISTLESGGAAPSLNTLRHIASVLDTVAAYFFEQVPGSNENSEQPPAKGNGRLRVVRPETRKVLIDPARGNVRWELISPDLQRRMEVVHMQVEPGATIGEEEWLVHEGEECGIVLDGALEIEFEDETFRLGSGDSLYFPSTRPHRIHNRSAHTATAIWIITPPSF
ncbi:MAG TPA: cupin domain-containing protein [Ktedonobacteraceae bacterium]|jgi:transcriptional regulator with XRE-family HTH domain|nr:cupin domain-containing protein [Ktedonobacteraceae bacterium]